MRGPVFADIVADPLPEALLDRVRFDVRVGYPDAEAEVAILRATAGAPAARPAGPVAPWWPSAVAVRRLLAEWTSRRLRGER